jgi:hypothetical protein
MQHRQRSRVETVSHCKLLPWCILGMMLAGNAHGGVASTQHPEQGPEQASKLPMLNFARLNNGGVLFSLRG